MADKFLVRMSLTTLALGITTAIVGVGFLGGKESGLEQGIEQERTRVLRIIDNRSQSYGASLPDLKALSTYIESGQDPDAPITNWYGHPTGPLPPEKQGCEPEPVERIYKRR